MNPTPHRRFIPALGLLLTLGGTATTRAQSGAATPSGSRISRTLSPAQSQAQPYGLDIVSPVYTAGSDARALDFQTNVLPDTQSYLDQSFAATAAANPSTLVSLNPESLRLATDYDARVYFVGEPTSSHSSLGFRTLDIATGAISDTQLIFPDASTLVQHYDGSYGGLTRTTWEPLIPGDFVELGTLQAGQRLDFVLFADAVNGGTTEWWTQANLNIGGLQHAVIYARPNSPYLMIGFEETSASGGDFIDLVYAIDIGLENVAALLAAPEPSHTALLAGLLTLATATATRRRSHAQR